MNYSNSPKNSNWISKIEMYAIFVLLFVFIIACEKQNDAPDYNPPADHNISKDGVMHKSGLNQPTANCANCHGDDLKGGSSGVSCFACHGSEW